MKTRIALCPTLSTAWWAVLCGLGMALPVSCLCAETPTTLPAVLPAVLPAKAWLQPDLLRMDLEDRIATLTSLVLREQISRYAQVRDKVYELDRFETVVNVVDGVERYSDVRREKRDYRHVSQIEGIWSFGETVTLLRTTRDAVQAGFVSPGGDLDELRFHYPAESRRWFVSIDSKTYWLDFEGSIRLSPQSRGVERIAWVSAPLPEETGIHRILWTVDFHAVDVAGRSCNMPETAVYRVERMGREERADWNVTRFSPNGRYGSETAFRVMP